MSPHAIRYVTLSDCLQAATKDSRFANDLAIYRETVEKIAIIKKTVTSEVLTNEPEEITDDSDRPEA